MSLVNTRWRGRSGEASERIGFLSGHGLSFVIKSLRVGLMWVALCPLFASAEWFQDKKAIMGTEVSVTLWHDSAASGETAIKKVMDEMHRIDAMLSPYKPNSELSRVNQTAAARAVVISDEFFFLLEKSLFFSKVSHGAFDITFASVGRYYDYRAGVKPNQKKKAALMEAINFEHIQLDRTQKTVRFHHPQVYIDLGGIAKGHAVDRAAAILTGMGVQHATISAGGDSRVLGDKRGRPWIIGIKNPRLQPGGDETLIRMPLSDVAVSTSGDYERFFIDEASGARVHHILNPRTGDSASGVVSVTVLGDHGVDTDPLSTTVFVLGVESGLALINTLDGVDCIIIDRFGQAHYSDGLMDPNMK